MTFKIRPAIKQDVVTILQFIRELADYEKLLHEVEATEKTLIESLFGDKPTAHVVIAELDATPIGFALFFYNFSTFVGKPGIYLEDLYVQEKYRGKGYGKQLLSYLAKKAIDENCKRFEWIVLDSNTPSVELYRNLGAKSMDNWTIQRMTGDNLNKLADLDSA